jgi:hypothetical protein
VRIIVAYTLALTITGCLSGCASTPPPATDQERSAALTPLISCLIASARKLDDNRSDASTIALALRSPCAAEFARSRDVFGRSLNPAARRMFDREEDASFLQLATTVVLGERAKRQN